MKIILKAILLCLVLVFSARSYAQTDSIGSPKPVFGQDSLNAVLLREYQEKIAEFERLRVNDSINRANVKAQLDSLKGNDVLKKEELEKELYLLEKKEDERSTAKKMQIESLRLNAIKFPVTGFFDDTLFFVNIRLGILSAQERADEMTKRIDQLSDVYKFTPDSLKIIDAGSVTDLVFDDHIIMSISEDDALFHDTTMMALAIRCHQIISDEVMRYQRETSFKHMAKNIGLAILVIAIAWLVIFLINRFFRWTSNIIQGQEGKRLLGFKFNDYTLLDSQKQVKTVLKFNQVIRWIIILLVIYINLPLLFGIFPWTQHLAQTLFGYVLNPLRKIIVGFFNYLPNLITIVVVFVVYIYFLKGFYFLKSEIEKENLKLPGFYPDWANPTYQIVRVLLFAFLIVVIFPYLPGSDSPVFKGVSVFLGFLFTFGSAGSLSNIIAGLVLTYMRLFKIGDIVKIGDILGKVIEKSLLVTRIRTPKHEIISIPNSTVMNSHTINYSSDAPEKGLIIYTTVTIGYDVPWRDMHKALIDAALRTELLLKEPEPFVLQTSLDDFYVSYQINAYTRVPNKLALIYSNLHQNIQDVCNERGIEIMSPHYRSARDGNMTTIPGDYLPKDYTIPGFNVFIKKGNEKQENRKTGKQDF